jgi:hypothetical protein
MKSVETRRGVGSSGNLKAIEGGDAKRPPKVDPPKGGPQQG